MKVAKARRRRAAMCRLDSEYIAAIGRAAAYTTSFNKAVHSREHSPLRAAVAGSRNRVAESVH